MFQPRELEVKIDFCTFGFFSQNISSIWLAKNGTESILETKKVSVKISAS